MDDFEITKQGIVIIQWLNYGDRQLGEELFHNISNKENERENYFVAFYKVQTKTEFIDLLQHLIKSLKVFLVDVQVILQQIFFKHFLQLLFSASFS